MTPRISSTTKVNRAALDAIRAGAVDGLEAVGQRILSLAHPPDDPPIGVGLVDTGAYGIWVDGRKVAGFAAKPRQAATKQGITLLVGYDFPGHFAEGGTIHETARPFLTPAVIEAIPETDSLISAAVQRRLGR